MIPTATPLPDYRHVVDAAWNRVAARTPLYEHIISDRIMEQIMGVPFTQYAGGDDRDIRRYFHYYNDFWRQMGYDTVSYECCIGPIMPGSGALGGHQPGVIRSRSDFATYPWADVPRLFAETYDRLFAAMGEQMPAGMKAVGGPGNGVFECVQDLVGYTDLCYIAVDDPDLYRDLFAAVGTAMSAIWRRFLPKFGDHYAVFRFGDDLGFKSSTLISVDDIRQHIVPPYREIVGNIRPFGKPFLWHSCGSIFAVMDDMIGTVGINAKHSNEDQIAPFRVWVERYGDRIGNFGGVDADVLCRSSTAEIAEYTAAVYDDAYGHGGFALGSGNSIPDYIPIEGYLAMVETARRKRGEFT